jgi:hypothetical protein
MPIEIRELIITAQIANTATDESALLIKPEDKVKSKTEVIKEPEPKILRIIKRKKES